MINPVYTASRAIIDALDEARDFLPEELAAEIQAYRSNEYMLAEKIASALRAAGQAGGAS